MEVTELAGDDVTGEQIERICNRYYWASNYCNNKDVLEAACGTGQGLGFLAKLAKSVSAGDYSGDILKITQSYYGNKILIKRFDAQEMPYPDDSMDVIILFEAIYYLPSPEKFVMECRRILRNGGKVLIATANKDLYDFNPSPYSYKYYGVTELNQLLTSIGFAPEFFGSIPVNSLSWRQKIFRPLKRIAVSSGLIPKTMNGKKFLKRIVFGKLVPMPAEITKDMVPYTVPIKIPSYEPDRNYKVIYCAATLKKG